MYSFQLDSTVYFVTLTISGIFSIIFSVAFAYVSDVTEESGEGTKAVCWSKHSNLLFQSGAWATGW